MVSDYLPVAAPAFSAMPGSDSASRVTLSAVFRYEVVVVPQVELGHLLVARPS